MSSHLPQLSDIKYKCCLSFGLKSEKICTIKFVYQCITLMYRGATKYGLALTIVAVEPVLAVPMGLVTLVTPPGDI